MLIPIAIILIIDFYVFQAIRFLFSDLSTNLRRNIYFAYWFIPLLAIISIVSTIFMPFNEWPKFLRIYFLGIMVVIYLCKILVVLFLLVDDLIRLVKWIIQKINYEPAVVAPQDSKITRSEFINKSALIVATIPLVTLGYGMMIGAFRLKLRKVSLTFNKLPKTFNGLKIIQISDIHTGSFVSTDHLEHAVKNINKQKPDVIFFTGDMVNNVTEEINPFVEVLAKLEAKMGIFTVLGNHDYGYYTQWPDEESKRKNLQDLFEVYKKLGWQLLNNVNTSIQTGKEKIAIVGVENWSAFSNFPKYGDLKKAMQGVNKDTFTILLSHDPTHWDAEVVPHEQVIDLTLSGHTHGMQFGIETPAFRWSPSQYIFKEWAGLYKKNDRYLYVNRGLGFLGYPGRVGIRPEITTFILKNE